MKTLQHYIEKRHVRYMPDTIKAELAALVPACRGDAAEQLFWVLHGLSAYPSCAGCGAELSSRHWKPFLKEEHRTDPGVTQGYTPFCGRSCAYTHGTKQESYRQTSLQRYGVTHPMKHESVVAKLKATNIDRHGDSNPMRWTGAKFLELMQQRHGTSVVRNINGVHEKIAANKLEQTRQLLPQKIAEMEKLFEVQCLSKVEELSFSRVDDVELTWQHRCGRSWQSPISFRGIRSCPSCSSGTSRGEQELAKFIETQGLEVQLHRRDIIAPRELDIYVPALGLALEFDGTYWHNAKFETRERCLDKLERCEKQGLRLITVQEHLWVAKRELVESRLLSIFGTSRRLGARGCKVVELDTAVTKPFLEAHHLQGSARSTVRLGLLHRDELVAVATFGKPRWSSAAEWELIRLASKQGVTVQGGASKLIKAFRAQHSGTLISYADRCWSTGNVYRQLGFTFSHNTTPSYWWVHHTLGAWSRYQTQKSKLPRLLGDLKKTFYPELSEEDNMRMAGFLPLYDRGNSAWLLPG